MMFPVSMMHDTVWMGRLAYDEAVEHYQLMLTKNLTAQVTESHAKTDDAPITPEPPKQSKPSPLVDEIAKARDSIKQSLSSMTPSKATPAPEHSHITKIEEENKSLRKLVEDLSKQISSLELRVGKLEGTTTSTTSPVVVEKAAEKKKSKDDDDDDDFDMFADDDDDDEEDDELESEANIKRKEELVRQYNAKKAKKVALIAKSSIILDVKPWDDETDMAEVERCVRTIEMDGLVWGAGKLVPLAYGIKKLQIGCVVEDEKVGSEILTEEIQKFDELVQSVDIAAFNKV